ncbi:MAG: hypothetical protein ABIT71_25745, partial [Vicinamibacteraceae bacterium]
LWIVSRGGAPPQQVQTPAAPSPIPAPSTAPPTPAPRPVPAPDPGPALSPARAVFAITLSPIVPRGASAQPVHRTPGGAVDLDLRLEGTPEPGASGYDVELQTVDGRPVWRGRARAGSSPEGLLATVRIPLETVPADDYVVVVTSRGGNDRGRYVLRLRRR